MLDHNAQEEMAMGGGGLTCRQHLGGKGAGSERGEKWPTLQSLVGMSTHKSLADMMYST